VGACARGRISTLFVVIEKPVLSRNFDQSMLKNAYFEGKTRESETRKTLCLRKTLRSLRKI